MSALYLFGEYFVIMTTKIYQVDAFTSELFGGNPAGICPLDKWLSDDFMALSKIDGVFCCNCYSSW